jgi:hypothetical protein
MRVFWRRVRCDRGKNYPKTRIHNHLAFSVTPSNSQLSKPGLQH